MSTKQRLFLSYAAAFGLGLSTLLSWNDLRADSGEVWSPERLLPEKAAPIKTDFNLRGKGDDDLLYGEAFLRTPLVQGNDGYLLLEGHGLYGRSWDDERGFFQGSLGLVHRNHLFDDTAGGINAFVDIGDYGEFLGQASLGFELESVFEDKAALEATSLRLGGNAYLPFEDYSEDRDLTRAPRLGGDLYLGLGRQWSEHRLEGFVTGFHYVAGDEGRALWGGKAELEWSYEGIGGMPEGSHLYANAGARYDSHEDGLSPTFGFGFSIALNEDAAGHDRVAEVRRNIAYGTAFVPIRYRQLAAAPASMIPLVPPSEDLGCGPGGPPLADSVQARVPLDHGGAAQMAPVGTTLLQLLGLDAIVAGCTVTFGGGEGTPTQTVTFSQCVETLAALDSNPMDPTEGLSINNSSGSISWTNPYSSCDTNVELFSG